MGEADIQADRHDGYTVSTTKLMDESDIQADSGMMVILPL